MSYADDLLDNIRRSRRPQRTDVEWAAPDGSACESPIEQRFYDAFVSRHPEVPLLCQHEISLEGYDYRLDFVSGALCIECDGHEFHEKTKEQAAHDHQLDRRLVRAGWLVLRFTGSEIWHDAAACVDEVVQTRAAIVQVDTLITERDEAVAACEQLKTRLQSAEAIDNVYRYVAMSRDVGTQLLSVTPNIKAEASELATSDALLRQRLAELHILRAENRRFFANAGQQTEVRRLTDENRRLRAALDTELSRNHR